MLVDIVLILCGEFRQGFRTLCTKRDKFESRTVQRWPGGEGGFSEEEVDIGAAEAEALTPARRAFWRMGRARGASGR